MAASDRPIDSPENSHMSDAELAAVVAEAARRRVPVMAHAHGAQGIAAAVRAGVWPRVSGLGFAFVLCFFVTSFACAMQVCGPSSIVRLLTRKALPPVWPGRVRCGWSRR